MESKKRGIRKAKKGGYLILMPFRVKRHSSNSYRGVISYPFCDYLDLKNNSGQLLLVGDPVSGVCFILHSSVLISRFKPILDRQRKVFHKIMGEVEAEAKEAEDAGPNAKS